MTPNPTMQAWQKRLIDVAKAEGKANPLPKYGADGYGGSETAMAVKTFQASHSLTVTGQFDDKTREALQHHSLVPPLSPLELGLIQAALGLFLPPAIAKEIVMFPTIVQFLIAFLPGVPDDLTLVKNELEELASTDTGVKKLRTALVFAKALIEKGEEILNKVDPEGANQPNPSQVAVKP